MSWIQTRKQPIQVETTKKFSKSQGTVLGRSFGYAALGFFVLAAITAGLTCAWEFGLVDDHTWNWNTIQGLNIGLTIGSFVLTITSAIVAMFWQAKMLTMQKTNLTWLVYGFFIVGQAFAFSWLMFMLNHTIDHDGNTLWWVCPAAFGLGFVLFGIFSLAGYGLGNKGQLTVKKMMMVVGLVTGIMFLTMFVFMFVFIWNPWAGNYGMYWICFMMLCLFMLLLFLSIMSIIGDIKRCSQFAQLSVPEQAQGEVVKRLSLVYGFSLLVEFVCLVWMLIWLIISVLGFSRRV